jgi:signal transduction histidine kinase
VETVATAECSVRLLARVFRSAVQHHDLLRENLRLRGDIKTLARRYNHDIRTPLGCINTLCILLRETVGPDHAVARESVDAIQNATAEIDSLLERVSFVTKASGEPLPATRFALGPVVQRAVDRVAALPEGLGLKLSPPSRPWPEVRAVDQWLEFVWFNLLHNAVRHGRKAAPIQSGWEPQGAELRFWIASKGAVPRAQQGNLLRPFHLLHQLPSGGLGLSLVERLVALQGGRCSYESGADDQAIFSFTLPALLAEPPTPATDSTPRPRYADTRARP